MTDADRLITEGELGGNLPEGYKYIDSWDEVTGTATSIKSIDVRYATYATSNSAITGTGKRYVDNMVNFMREGSTYKKPYVQPAMVKHPVLRMHTRNLRPAHQLTALRKVVTYGETKGITVLLNPIK